MVISQDIGEFPLLYTFYTLIKLIQIKKLCSIFESVLVQRILKIFEFIQFSNYLKSYNF